MELFIAQALSDMEELLNKMAQENNPDQKEAMKQLYNEKERAYVTFVRQRDELKAAGKWVFFLLPLSIIIFFIHSSNIFYATITSLLSVYIVGFQ